MNGHRPAGVWIAPFAVDGTMHVFALDPIKADTGVGGWLSGRAICQGAMIGPGAELATKDEAFHNPRFCQGCWVWMLTHADCQVIYAPAPGASIAEPEAVAARDLADHGWFVS